MKKLFLWLLPPVGFACGWILGIDDSAPSSQAAISSRSSHSEIAAPKTVTVSAPEKATTQPDSSAQIQKSVPPVTLREVLSYPSEMHRLSAFLQLLDTLPSEQFANLYAQLPPWDPHSSSSLEELFFRRWAQIAPEAAIEAATADKRLGGQYSAFVAWAERDAAAALAYAQKLPSLRWSTIEALEAMAFPKPGDLPPKDALRRIHEIHGPGEPSSAMCDAVGRILQEWAKTDPEAAWQEALTLPTGKDEQGLRGIVLRKIIESQASTDPKAATRLIEALPKSPERVMLQASYVRSLASGKHRYIAKAYAMGMPDGPDRCKVLSALAYSLLRVDQEEANALIANLPASDWQDPSVFDFFPSWLEKDSARATETFLAHIPKEIQVNAEQQTRYEQLFDTWCHVDPHAASDFLAKLPKSVRGRSLDTAVSAFCLQDASGAGEWAANLPPGPDRDDVMQQVGSLLASLGVNNVTNWLNQLPPDSGKFAAIEGFANTIFSTSPDDALTWIRTEPNEASRLERLKRVWNSWSDREAAQRWRDTSPELSEAERAALK